ncbi:MAG TPA: vitamin B12 dependent-methionine synthase activation domain-containing protein, partial [Chloroflexota bacterium]|nr:vitamin B12 dependent-methionine synthase activation domain-containing protein [Chloroflexota bacterium]
SVAHVEQFLERSDGYTKGRVVVATVFGDVHDIGKNLVCTILSNNGYTVYDLGKQVPLNRIIEKAIEVDATAIGLSALLVTTSKQMPLCVQELHRRGLTYPILIGGAAINRGFGYRTMYIDEATEYAPGVYYCKDAFEGLDTIDKLIDPERQEKFREELSDKARIDLGKHRPDRSIVNPATRAVVRSNVDRNAPIPQPPFWGYRLLGGSLRTQVRSGATASSSRQPIRLDDLFEYLDLKTLFRLHWGAKNREGAAWDRLLEEEYYPKLEELKRGARERAIILPEAVYGYFPSQSDGNDVIVYDPSDEAGLARLRAGAAPDAARVLERFTFPRQTVDERLCLADYFAEIGSGRVDVLPLQVVTAGGVADDLSDELNREGKYTESYYLHGFATQCAEGLAEYVHALVRRELGLCPDQGRRYSWGYPACPELSDHEKVFRLLPADQAGITLTEGWQLLPEQSTAAMVAHHPQAKYFSP